MKIEYMQTKIISLTSLFLIWLGLNGLNFDLIHLMFLFIAPILAFYISNQLALIPKRLAIRPIKSLKYFFWLVKEIILSSIVVSKIAWRKNLCIFPSIFPIVSKQNNEIGIVIFANSITLTPGTVSVKVDDNKLLVHSLDTDFMESLQTGDMDKRIFSTISNSVLVFANPKN